MPAVNDIVLQTNARLNACFKFICNNLNKISVSRSTTIISETNMYKIFDCKKRGAINQTYGSVANVGKMHAITKTSLFLNENFST